MALFSFGYSFLQAVGFAEDSGHSPDSPSGGGGKIENMGGTRLQNAV
jgi:hypothetical protein